VLVALVGKIVGSIDTSPPIAGWQIGLRYCWNLIDHSWSKGGAWNVISVHGDINS